MVAIPHYAVADQSVIETTTNPNKAQCNWPIIFIGVIVRKPPGIGLLFKDILPGVKDPIQSIMLTGCQPMLKAPFGLNLHNHPVSP